MQMRTRGSVICVWVSSSSRSNKNGGGSERGERLAEGLHKHAAKDINPKIHTHHHHL